MYLLPFDRGFQQVRLCAPPDALPFPGSDDLGSKLPCFTCYGRRLGSHEDRESSHESAAPTARVGAKTSAMQVTCLPPALPRGMERLGLYWLHSARVPFFSTCHQAVETGAWLLYLLLGV